MNSSGEMRRHSSKSTPPRILEPHVVTIDKSETGLSLSLTLSLSFSLFRSLFLSNLSITIEFDLKVSKNRVIYTYRGGNIREKLQDLFFLGRYCGRLVDGVA